MVVAVPNGQEVPVLHNYSGTGSWINTVYSDSQKHESSCLLSDCFLCISPEPLEL